MTVSEAVAQLKKAAKTVPAISYSRYSTLKQEGGDSERRQRDILERYLQAHPELKLLDARLDAGKSGLSGKNLRNGAALKAILDEVHSGSLPTPLALIVEQPDRLSRMEFR